ncbi:M1 family peptidase, partial [Flaviaesturariibacter flavus]
LRSGDSVRIRTPFLTKLPTYTSRGGHIDQSYMACQWYPKAAVYDRKGWHPMPYLDMGEYYNDFGNYDVRITLPGSYVVGATGVLQNEDERRRYIELGTSGYATPYTATAPEKTLHFTARNVTDFAWFADKTFRIRYDTLQLAPGKPVIDVFAFHHDEAVAGWSKSTDFIKSAVRSYSTLIGDYAYPTVQAVEGPGNKSSGGMEYPMITLINMPKASDMELDVVIGHEVGHNWFPMMVSTNERDFTWMDEGFNTYYENLYSVQKYNTLLVLGSKPQPMERIGSTDNLLKLVYTFMNDMKTTQPINIPATSFKNDNEYGMVSYHKTAVWMHRLETAVGRDAFRAAMKLYFREWQFRHPYPEDFQRTIQGLFRTDLSKYFADLNTAGPFAD